MPDTRPDMRQRALFVASNAACRWNKMLLAELNFIRSLLENYCFVLLTNRAPPQISDNRPDMRQRALFVTSGAAGRWNKMLLAREIVDSPLAAMVLATEHNALCASGCQPPSVDNGTGSRLNRVPSAWSVPLCACYDTGMLLEL